MYWPSALLGVGVSAVADVTNANRITKLVHQPPGTTAGAAAAEVDQRGAVVASGVGLDIRQVLADTGMLAGFAGLLDALFEFDLWWNPP
ncbi:hypothetical protein [Streptomyces sp. WM6372]|uniref:hypothetical protein n=1 Tax=Streptomyces sp. WM6372 TaxID=1415555 RepID=UPI00131D2FDD|nr:hypothetical protein [Streptomyces sp. WM6372]